MGGEGSGYWGPALYCFVIKYKLKLHASPCAYIPMVKRELINSGLSLFFLQLQGVRGIFVGPVFETLLIGPYHISILLLY